MLLVDDNDVLREQLVRAFERRGHQVAAAADYREAVVLARRQQHDRAIVDLRMPGGSGLDLLRELKQIQPDMQVLVLTGYGSIATAIDAIRLGAVNYLPKPADADDILAAFERGESEQPETNAEEPPAPSLARAEWEHIHRVLADCGGNLSAAARRLGIHRRSLQRKLKKLAPE